MKASEIDKIADAVLYEGYMLYPYRPSLKNQQRWTFGSVCPPVYAERTLGERSAMQTQVLLRPDGDPSVALRVRFLQLVHRKVGTIDPPLEVWPKGEPHFEETDELTVGDATYHPWQEAVKREVATPVLGIDKLLTEGVSRSFQFADGRELEPVTDGAGLIHGVLVREWQAIWGTLSARAEAVASDLYRLTVTLENQTAVRDARILRRDEAMLFSMASAQVVLTASQGSLVSLIDPSKEDQLYADNCQQVGWWPVLIGDEGDRDRMIAAPIILYDYPKIAPQSPGDLFDATEIDELLALRIQTLTDQEKQQVLATDGHTRQLLMRTDNLSAAEQQQLHGTMRRVGKSKEPAAMVHGRTLCAGDRVRLSPKRNADAFDSVLRGMTATIASIERDYENRVHLAVTLDDDPGADFGTAQLPGHRFFFDLDDVEPLPEPGGA